MEVETIIATDRSPLAEVATTFAKIFLTGAHLIAKVNIRSAE
jgi:hypothetical protein